MQMKQALPAHEEELVFVSFEFSQSRLAIGLRLQNITFSPDALNVQNVSRLLTDPINQRIQLLRAHIGHIIRP